MRHTEHLKNAIAEGSVIIYDKDGFAWQLGKDDKRIVVEALEKQIPKKPKLYEWDKFNHQYEYCCPSCGDAWNMNEYGAGMAYCWSCGQPIDWRGEKK